MIRRLFALVSPRQPQKGSRGSAPPGLRLPTTAEAVEAMLWSDMKALFASLFVDEIAAVRQDGGDAHLRRRVSALGPDDRNALWAAFAEVPR